MKNTKEPEFPEKEAHAAFHSGGFGNPFVRGARWGWDERGKQDRAEIEKMKNQLAWNLVNNDEFGCEFVGITLLKAELKAWKEQAIKLAKFGKAWRATRPYHDCIDAGLPQCEQCDFDEILEAFEQFLRDQERRK